MRYQIFEIAIAACLFLGCQETGGPSARGFALPAGDAEQGRAAFVELKCYTCHEVAGLERELPRPTATPVVDVKLGGLAMREPTDGELVTSIVNPPHDLYPGGEEERITSGGESRMANYNEVITAQQLIDLVAFLHERYETTTAEGGSRQP
ncbi:MAG TPA: c-type cytochrome [Vicinamibacteria bacterium]|nr:c-type cytochrome [Vicinamibacteria bacterium]